ncbi:MAG: hypothetical protein AAB779_01730, partial [Patescibacteria group bacterium]
MFTSGGVSIVKIGLFQVLITLVGFFIFGANVAQATNLAGYPGSGLMSLANSPYIVTGDITVNNGNTLTIEPGVIVKMQSGRQISVQNGQLIIGSA